MIKKCVSGQHIRLDGKEPKCNCAKKFICTNCGRPIGKIGILCPSTNPKIRNMCLSCAEKMIGGKDEQE